MAITWEIRRMISMINSHTMCYAKYINRVLSHASLVLFAHPACPIEGGEHIKLKSIGGELTGSEKCTAINQTLNDLEDPH